MQDSYRCSCSVRQAEGGGQQRRYRRKEHRSFFGMMRAGDPSLAFLAEAWEGDSNEKGRTVECLFQSGQAQVVNLVQAACGAPSSVTSTR